MRPAIGLRRVSTDKQAKGSDSPAMQDERIRHTAALRQRDLVTIYGSHVEGSSGGVRIAERHDAQAAVDHAIRLKGELIVDDLSRLGRIADDLEVCGKEMLHRGANIYCIQQCLDWEVAWQTAAGRFVLGIHCHLAQFTRDETSEKTRRHLRTRKETGRRWSGKLPYGYMLDPTKTRTRTRNGREEDYHSDLMENPAEQRIIAVVRELAAAGMSAEKIVYELYDRRLWPRKGPGEYWQATQVRRLINGRHQ